MSKPAPNEDGIVLPTCAKKFLGYLKIGGVLSGAIAGTWIAFASVYAIPTQLKDHGAQLEKVNTTVSQHETDIKILNIYKEVDGAALQELTKDVSILEKTAAAQTRALMEVNASLIKLTENMSYLQTSVKEIKDDVKELRRSNKSSALSFTSNSFTSSLDAQVFPSSDCAAFMSSSGASSTRSQ